MAKNLQRKKPGYTKNGEVKIISLNVQQLTALLDKTQFNKRKAKIQQRINRLKSRPGYQEPVVVETQPV
jgi:DNA polymerase III sliding clamp (beta) subunit (PCNA family)